MKDTVSKWKDYMLRYILYFLKPQIVYQFNQNYYLFALWIGFSLGRQGELMKVILIFHLEKLKWKKREVVLQKEESRY